MWPCHTSMRWPCLVLQQTLQAPRPGAKYCSSHFETCATDAVPLMEAPVTHVPCKVQEAKASTAQCVVLSRAWG